MRSGNRCFGKAILPLALATILAAIHSTAVCQESTLRNGGMETLTDEGLPESWNWYSRQKDDLVDAGVDYIVDTSSANSGANCLLIDTSQLRLSSIGAYQLVAANDYANKRVRLRASIRLEAKKEANKNTDSDQDTAMFASLTIEVYGKDVNGLRRSIASEQVFQSASKKDDWQHLMIVLDIPENAETIEINLNVTGKTKAWFDGVSLKAVDANTKLTSPPQFDQAQSFFNWWMVLPAIGLCLFVLAVIGAGSPQRFAIRFSVSYWAIYFSSWWIGQFNFLEFDFSDLYQARTGIVNWFTWSVLQINLFPGPSGSGDTRYHYAELLTVFVFSICVAICWSCIDWRKSDQKWLKDFWWSFLRYSLAIALLTYGLGKLNPDYSQFRSPSFDQLNSTYGDSSPMGLLWRFMGSSQPYTIFAGIGEVIPALLLVWRRTANVGALVAAGVMTNVVMLNLCYDVPVKLFSTHLLFASLLVLLPNLSRISKALLTQDALEKATLSAPYATQKNSWLLRAIKTILIIFVIFLPTYESIALWANSPKPEFFGEYTVEALPTNELGTDTEAKLTTLNFFRLPFARDEEKAAAFTDIISITSDDGSRSTATVILDSLSMEMKVVDFEGRRKLFPNQFKIKVLNTGRIELSNESKPDEWALRLQKRERDFLLNSRGFHWVNERAFNR